MTFSFASIDRSNFLHLRLISHSEYLRTFALIVSAHPYCTQNSQATSFIKRAQSSEVNNNRANGHCYDFAWI